MKVSSSVKQRFPYTPTQAVLCVSNRFRITELASCYGYSVFHGQKKILNKQISKRLPHFLSSTV